MLDSARFGRTPVQFLLVLAACCLVAIVALVIVVAQRGPAPALVGLGLAVLPIPLLVILILYLDRLEPEPRALLAGMFGAGAGIAVITLLLGRAFGAGAITPPELGPHAGHEHEWHREDQSRNEVLQRGQLGRVVEEANSGRVVEDGVATDQGIDQRQHVAEPDVWGALRVHHGFSPRFSSWSSRASLSVITERTRPPWINT